jgi:hypothetical protein
MALSRPRSAVTGARPAAISWMTGNTLHVDGGEDVVG